MKSHSIRLIVIIAALSVLGIVLTQSYWLNRAFGLQEKQFDQQVQIALNRVAEQLLAYHQLPLPMENPITRVSSNYYAVMVNNPIEASLLEDLLVREFSRSNLSADFEYGIYDCQTEKLVYGSFVSMQPGSPAKTSLLPAWPQENYYFSILFSSREQYLTGSMAIWLFSSFVLVVVIIFFSYATFVILKQKRLSEVQKDFINNMTHEVKTPVSTILLSAEMLLKNNPPDKETIKTYTTLISKEALRIKGHAEQVLQIAEIEKEQLHLNKDLFDAHELMAEVAENLPAQYKKRGATVKFQPGATKSMIVADKLHFTNMLYNLLDNACKYCPHTPEIILRTSNFKGHFMLSVSDNGPGIAEEEQKKIFRKFYRVPSGNLHDVKGYGLGLYYVKCLMKAHKGAVLLKSQSLKGSIFELRFPLTR